jgi:hypothetical protein
LTRNSYFFAGLTSFLALRSLQGRQSVPEKWRSTCRR